ncbi:hypothetical protein CLHOM_12120 [Clostridium homopropionicum DSM 5847]|uniref:Uncharacterized protein n=1 Tax=Clostridium homopropionicum DSM 5847 TaxID=1121318 RepID=A0A0L6ZC71_9CLOT|nr:hypothetical protein [Clostridium homopropionicum]KOA20393.1 hypothetical protein CLHOM_12120 [Clostridium homopropionicum DSM 5847]SFG75018.1 hypothetical protein SAMN04488501_11547 [Clostridium homopropionicum]
MVAHIAYWVLFAVMLFTTIIFIATKRFTFIDFVVYLSFWAFSETIDILVLIQFQMYYYVNNQVNIIYALLYHCIVYPTFGLIFSRLFPKKREILNLVKYNVLWIIFNTVFELVYVEATGTIVYLKWLVIPYSLLFYSVWTPLMTVYYLLVDKWLKKSFMDSTKKV